MATNFLSIRELADQAKRKAGFWTRTKAVWRLIRLALLLRKLQNISKKYERNEQALRKILLRKPQNGKKSESSLSQTLRNYLNRNIGKE